MASAVPVPKKKATPKTTITPPVNPPIVNAPGTTVRETVIITDTDKDTTAVNPSPTVSSNTALPTSNSPSIPVGNSLTNSNAAPTQPNAASAGTNTALVNKTFTGGAQASSSVTPNNSGNLSTGSILAVVGGVLVAVATVTVLTIFFLRRMRRKRSDREHSSAASFRIDESRYPFSGGYGSSPAYPRPPSMIEQHVANTHQYHQYNGYGNAPVAPAHSYPEFNNHINPYPVPSQGVRSYSPDNNQALPPLPRHSPSSSASHGVQENPPSPPAYTPSDVSTPTTSETHYVGRVTTQSIPATAYTEPSVYSQNTEYITLTRGASSTSGSGNEWPNEKAGYGAGTGNRFQVANPTIPAVPPVPPKSDARQSSASGVSTVYSIEDAYFKMDKSAPPVPPIPEASGSSSRDNRRTAGMSTVYSIEDAYGGV